MRSGDFCKALNSYCVAIDKQKQLINNSRQHGGIGRMNFVLAVRLYQKGLALYQLVRSFYDNNALLAGRIKQPILNAKLAKAFENFNESFYGNLLNLEITTPLLKFPERRTTLDSISFEDLPSEPVYGD